MHDAVLLVADLVAEFHALDVVGFASVCQRFVGKPLDMSGSRQYDGCMISIATAHKLEIAELEDALIDDDGANQHGYGAVLWASTDDPIGAVARWLGGATP